MLDVPEVIVAFWDAREEERDEALEVFEVSDVEDDDAVPFAASVELKDIRELVLLARSVLDELEVKDICDLVALEAIYLLAIWRLY